MTRRELALDAFWTERPLVQRFIAATGRTSFSLRELIAFAQLLGDPVFLELANEVGRRIRSARPVAAAPTRRPSLKARRRRPV